MCDYCNETKELKIEGLLNKEFERFSAITNNCGVHTFDFGILDPFYDLAVIVINYCPICGRKLSDTCNQ